MMPISFCEFCAAVNTPSYRVTGFGKKFKHSYEIFYLILTVWRVWRLLKEMFSNCETSKILF